MGIDFETIHRNFNGMMLDLCAECHGSCEENEIAIFLPGEAEFVAKKLHLSPPEFTKKYCNIIRFQNHDIYVSKVGNCPLLDDKYRCLLEEPNCKLLHCLLYPVLIGIAENKIRVFVADKNCPMAHRITDDFKNKAVGVYEGIKNDIPTWWLEFISKYDEVVYDYAKLERLRDKQFIEADELDDCIVK